jgi:hypothetical protein
MFPTHRYTLPPIHKTSPSHNVSHPTPFPASTRTQDCTSFLTEGGKTPKLSTSKIQCVKPETRTYTIQAKKTSAISEIQNAKGAHHTNFQLQKCPNGHMFWVNEYTQTKTKTCQHKSSSDRILFVQDPSDRIRNFSSLRYSLQSPGSISSDRILFPLTSTPLSLYLPTVPECVFTKKILHTPQQRQQDSRTNLGHNTRTEAIRDTQSDILESLKCFSKFTTDTTNKKLYGLSFDAFDEHKAALPRYKPLCDRTIRPGYNGWTNVSTKNEQTRIPSPTFRGTFLK